MNATHILPFNILSAKVSHLVKTNISGIRKCPLFTLVGRTAMSHGKGCECTITYREGLNNWEKLSYLSQYARDLKKVRGQMRLKALPHHL